MYNLIFLLTIIITLSSQGYINSTYRKTKKMASSSGLTGKEVAQKILDKNNLQGVKVMMISGELTDHYDPTNKTVCLSQDIYAGTSLASISVASHECGHAIQDKEGFTFLKIRRKMVPLVNFASKAGYIIILISVIMSMLKLLWIGILLEGVILLFQVVTLPVEFDASKRALGEIKDLKIVEEKGHDKCRKMLTAAALTYVASVATAILEILRLIFIARRND